MTMNKLFFLSFIICCLVGCNNKVSYLGIKQDTIPVSGPHLVFLSLKNPEISSLPLKSSLFKLGKDSLVITMVDKNKNRIFNEKEDLLIITSPDSPYIPVYKDFNPNTTPYSKDLIISYQENLLQIKNVSIDGESIQLKYIGNAKKVKIKAQAVFEDFIDPTIKIRELFSNKEIKISNLLLSQATSSKFIYFHFWYTSCIPCIEEIPELKKLEEKGITVVNIALEKFDDPIRLKEIIKKFDYPGEHYFGNNALIKNLGQNGFPFGVLVESASGKKIKSDNNIKEIFAEY